MLEQHVSARTYLPRISTSDLSFCRFQSSSISGGCLFACSSPRLISKAAEQYRHCHACLRAWPQMREDKHYINTPVGRIALRLIHYSCQVWQSRVLVQVVQKGQHASSSFQPQCWGVLLMAFLPYQGYRWEPTNISRNQEEMMGLSRAALSLTHYGVNVQHHSLLHQDHAKVMLDLHMRQPHTTKDCLCRPPAGRPARPWKPCQ